jgi:hypothetical protein
MRHVLAAITLALSALSSTASASNSDEPTPAYDHFATAEQRLCRYVFNGEMFARTELFFGLSRPDGSEITEAEFDGFIDAKVTPRFPDGLTLLSGDGQFRDSTGAIIEEGSKLLILLYPLSRESSALVDDIRDDYKDQFQQQSVLRVDEQSCVSF